MKITRRQLRKLISEAYQTGIPFRSALEQSDTFIAQKHPDFGDTLSPLEPNQREFFKQALDPSRPEPDVVLERPTIHVVILDENSLHPGKRVEVEVPRDLADDFIHAHQKFKAFVGNRSPEDINRQRKQFPFKSAQRNAFNNSYYAVEDPYFDEYIRLRNYIDNYVRQTYKSGVPEYTQTIKGYGAARYRAAWNDSEYF